MKISCFCQTYKDRKDSYLPANLQAMLTGNQSAFIAAFLYRNERKMKLLKG